MVTIFCNHCNDLKLEVMADGGGGGGEGNLMRNILHVECNRKKIVSISNGHSIQIQPSVVVVDVVVLDINLNSFSCELSKRRTWTANSVTWAVL